MPGAIMSRQDSFLPGLEEQACKWLMAVMTLIVFFAVVLRYGFNYPLGWTDEAAKICFTWIVFLGGVIGVRREIHISIDVVVKYLPLAPRKVLNAIGDLSIGLLLVVIIIYGIRLSAMTSRVKTPILGISLVFIYGAAPLTALLMLYHHLKHMYKAYLGSYLVEMEHPKQES
jgi:TRAP-type C4-dicarboxylate transport system permease small subunit